jgi:integrase/recombinase XerC/integrase/recombinase XerD
MRGAVTGTIHQLHPDSAEVTISTAVDCFLAEVHSPGTRRAYASTLRALIAEMGDTEPLAVLDGPAGARRLTEWFHARWDSSTPATFNRNLDAVKSAVGYWRRQTWLHSDATRAVLRRRRAPDRSRALSRAEIERLLTRGDIALREKTLWRMLYETAARSAEVLALDAEDLDLPNRQAKVRRKGGASDIIRWQTKTAQLLPRLLARRRTGPVFLTDRQARVALAPGDIDLVSGRARLSYRRAAEIFEKATGGWTLHQLRHSALTHAAEDGWNTPALMAYSGHTSVASLARYARVSPEALGRLQDERDPARRR